MRKEVLENATSLARAGFTVFKLKGKTPVVKWRKHPYTVPFEVEDYFSGWSQNYGVAPTRDQLIIDIDPRNFKKDDKPHKRLFDLIGLTSPETPIVKTGGGGYHIYFNIKDMPSEMKIRKNIKEYKGLDFISDGAYVVGPGSFHPETGMEYVIQKTFNKIMDAPQALIDLLTTKKKLKTIDDTKSLKDDDKTVTDIYQSFLETTPAAEEGDSGDLITYKVACAGRDYALSPGKTLEMMVEFYNPRCDPPWDHEDLQLKVTNAFEYASGGRGDNLVENDFGKIEKNGKDPKYARWDKSGNNKKSNPNNVINQFKPLLMFGQESNPLYETLVFNEFNGQLNKVKWMPWDKPKGKTMPEGGYEWTENDGIELRNYLSVKRRFDPPRSTIDDAVVSVAREKTIHPIKDYLLGLKWDGRPRLEKWLIKNSGASDTSMNREISRVTIMQAVARIFHPGCQCDTVTILEGKQGIRKTSVVRLLGGEWYAEINIDPGNKDTADGMRGKWFLEMAEMEVTRRADANALKAFISRSTDRYRPAYARTSIDIPRQSTFIGTFNPDALGQYLNDPTGSRRFLPLELGDTTIDTNEIERIRDQLFAEATEKILQGELWHITNNQVLVQLEIEQGKRQMEDGWSSVIADFATTQTAKYIRGIDVFVDAIHGHHANYRFHEQRRVANCLKECGFRKITYRLKGRAVSGFLNPNYDASAKEEDLYG